MDRPYIYLFHPCNPWLKEKENQRIKFTNSLILDSYRFRFGFR